MNKLYKAVHSKIALQILYSTTAQRGAYRTKCNLKVSSSILFYFVSYCSLKELFAPKSSGCSEMKL